MRPDPRDPEPVAQDHHRHEQHRPGQQPPVDPEQHRDADHELHDGLPRVVDHLEHEVAHAVGVVAEQARHAAGLDLVNLVQRELDGVLVGGPAGVDPHAGRGLGRRPPGQRVEAQPPAPPPPRPPGRSGRAGPAARCRPGTAARRRRSRAAPGRRARCRRSAWGPRTGARFRTVVNVRITSASPSRPRWPTRNRQNCPTSARIGRDRRRLRDSLRSSPAGTSSASWALVAAALAGEVEVGVVAAVAGAGPPAAADLLGFVLGLDGGGGGAFRHAPNSRQTPRRPHR